MPIQLYMDQHVPRAITVGLQLRGVRVVTAFEDGFARQLQVSIGKCIDDLALIAQAGEPDDLKNRVEYLPLKP